MMDSSMMDLIFNRVAAPFDPDCSVLKLEIQVSREMGTLIHS